MLGPRVTPEQDIASGTQVEQDVRDIGCAVFRVRCRQSPARLFRSDRAHFSQDLVTFHRWRFYAPAALHSCRRRVARCREHSDQYVVSQPTRRRVRIDEPSEDRRRRSGCLVWGAVLGVLAGIMVGVYVLPPVLRHFYGEKHIAADEFYEGGGKLIRLDSVGQTSEPLGDPAAGSKRADFFASIVVVSNSGWAPKPTDFSLQFADVDDWKEASEATVQGQPLQAIQPGVETTIQLHFVLELPSERFPDAARAFALHLSNPRVRFEIAQ